MADSPFELSVDSDWKKQAREEKRKLAEEAAAKQAAPAKPAPSRSPAAPSRPSPTAEDEGPADFAGLVQSLASQALLYLGSVPVRANGEGMVDLDTARRQIRLLEVLEQKTAGNIDDSEQQTLDVALYQTRSRFSTVAQRYIL
jgi:3-oxoacyl-ACP reductase-like protein